MKSSYRHSVTRLLTAAASAALLLWMPLAAQQTFDRNKVPPPGKQPALRVPAWTKAKLANGADLIVSEKHDLPLVSFTITFLGGANQFESPERTGIASVV